MIDRRLGFAARAARNRCLPKPEDGASLEKLRPFFKVDYHGWILIRAFLVAALRPGFPLPILVAKGEQGAGKSTACRIIIRLLTLAPRRTEASLVKFVTRLPPPETPGSCVSTT